MDFQKTEQVLTKYAKYVVQQSRSNLTKGKNKSSGKLYQSISYDLDVEKDAFLLDFLMEGYGAFQDKGVKGIKSTYSQSNNSPFRFGRGTGKSGGLTQGIGRWLRQKRFQWKDKKGRFMSYKSMQYIIVNSIYRKGLKATMFFTKPFDKGLERMGNNLVDAFILDIENNIVFGETK